MYVSLCVDACVRFQLLHDAERRAAEAEAAAAHARREAHFAGVQPGPYEPPVRPSVRGIAGLEPRSLAGAAPLLPSSSSSSGSLAASSSPPQPPGASALHKFKSLASVAAALGPSPAQQQQQQQQLQQQQQRSPFATHGALSSLRRVPSDRESRGGVGFGGASSESESLALVPRLDSRDAAFTGSNVADLAEMLFNDLETISKSYVDGLNW